MKRVFVWVVLGLMVVLSACQVSSPVEESALEPSANYTWNNVKMNGMGFVTGLEIHPTTPNLVYIRTDVGGLFRWEENSSSWTPLSDRFTTSQNGQSVESLALDAKQPNVVYFAANGNIYKSVDRGEPSKPWQIVPLRDSSNQPVYMNGNGVWRGMGERLAVDPNNSNIVYFGSRKQGLFRSIDGGRNWQNIFKPPQDTNDIGVVFVAFDPTSQFSGKDRSQVIYLGVASSSGANIYRSQNGGTSWEPISRELPRDSYPARYAMSKYGTLYITFMPLPTQADPNSPYKRGGIWRLQQGVWKNITPPNIKTGYVGISVDSFNTTSIITYTVGFAKNSVLQSNDRGDSWKTLQGSVQVPSWWPSTYASGAFYGYSGALRHDPHVRGRAWVTDGYGVLRANNIAQPNWVAQMNNLEEMCIIALKSPPSGAPLFTGTADNHGFRHADLNVVPSATFTKGEFGITTGIDFFAKDPNIMVRVGSDQSYGASKRGVSYDNGKTWQAFNAPRSITPGNTSEAFDGNIALSSSNNRVWVWAPNPGYKERAFDVYLTLDAGQSWNRTTGINNPSYNPALSQPWFTSQALAADPVLPDTFYFYQTVTQLSGTWTRGIVYRGKVENGKLNFIRVSSGVLPEDYRVELKAAPGMAGELWFTNKGDSEPAEKRGGNLFRSSNGGQSWTQISGFTKTRSVAFGKPVSGTKPIVFVYGVRSGVEGIYRSDNATLTTGNASNATWQLISGANPTFGNLTVLEGDKQVAGRVYAGTGCRGAWVGEPN
jgi:xyloglucan-specific exo-beta-1,4-glucanase